MFDEERTADETAAIEFRNVSMSFDEKRVLEDISFKLRRGQMIFVTGASGSGKSVLLRLAIALTPPDEGQIFVEGREVETLDETELLAIRGGSMGIVFQEDSLFTGLKAYDNVAYRLVEHGWPEDETERAVMDVLRFVGLERDAELFPEEMSGGMRRRLEIARAMVGWPSIMLFDEPTSGLDPVTATQVLDLIIQARDAYHISSLFVTKELHEIPYLAGNYASVDEKGNAVIREVKDDSPVPDTKVMLLDKGRIAFEGSVNEFASSTMPAVTYMTRTQGWGTPIRALD